jgi:hypothetical protein
MKSTLLALTLLMLAPALAQQPKIPFITSPAPVSINTIEPTNDLVRYFSDIALGSQLGGASSYLRRWQQPLRFVVAGQDHPALRAELMRIIDELQAMVPSLRLQQVKERKEANFVVFFGRSLEYATSVEPNFLPYAIQNTSGFWLRWQGSHICSGSLYVDPEKIAAIDDQRYLLRTMLTRSLGLMQVSPRYDNTVFNSGWQQRLEYSDLDRQMVTWHYHLALRPGLGRNGVIERLNQIALTGRSQAFFSEVWSKTLVRLTIKPNVGCTEQK